jgi:hypothetical protein
VGLKSFQLGGREALEFACDGTAHRSEPWTAWFDCGSGLGNLALAIAAGWTERRSPKPMWLCPQCAQKSTLKQAVRLIGPTTPRLATPLPDQQKRTLR